MAASLSIALLLFDRQNPTRAAVELKHGIAKIKTLSGIAIQLFSTLRRSKWKLLTRKRPKMSIMLKEIVEKVLVLIVVVLDIVVIP
jgi:hypothetical protein